jgi:hypothetical protein
MVTDNVLEMNRIRHHGKVATPGLLARIVVAVVRRALRFWCGLHGHLIMLHFEPNRLSLQCSLCGYQSEGWEVGSPMVARRQAGNPPARAERRSNLRALPSKARLAS